MQFGVQFFPCVGPDTKDAQTYFRECLEIGEEADELGFTHARMVGATLKAGEEATYPLDPARHAYLVAATGDIEVNDIALHTRDGAAVTGETELRIRAINDSEIVLVDAA